MKSKFAGFLLHNILGWSYEDKVIAEAKCIVLGFPHTCVSDFIIFFLYTRAIGEKMYVMVKKELYVWPLRRMMSAIGIVPVDRTRGAGVLKQCIDEFGKRESFHIAMSPEGTRKAVKRWKKGFHTLASATGAGVYLGYYDWKNKFITTGERFEISKNADADLEAIQRYYKYKTTASGKYPEKVAYPDGI